VPGSGGGAAALADRQALTGAAFIVAGMAVIGCRATGIGAVAIRSRVRQFVVVMTVRFGIWDLAPIS
jgi:hypothetical protein